MDEYKILEKIRDGGQKKVYLIQHTVYGKCVLKYGKCSSSASLDRIKREVSLLKSIDSKYFPKNFSSEFLDNGEFTIFEEFIKSQTLREKKDEYYNSEKKVIELLIELINGLKIIWDAKVVHRDLKPDNILIRDEGQPVIIDLGIARILDEKSLTLTIFQQGPCTPIYASPEQLKNKKNNIDMRSDFFSLAIVAAELILGVHPFSPDVVNHGLGIYDNILNGNYKLDFGDVIISQEFKTILTKCLNPEPFQRIRTYEKLQSELENILR